MTLIPNKKEPNLSIGSGKADCAPITENEQSLNGSSTSEQDGVETYKERRKKASKKRAQDYSPEFMLDLAKAHFRYSGARGKLFYRQGPLRGHAVRQGKHNGYSTTAYWGLRWWVHRIVWMIVNNAPILPGTEIDHINGKRADNRPSNLRVVTRGQNQWNAGMRKDNTSGIKGVARTRSGTFAANISINGKVKYLGAFPTALEAARVYQDKALELRGEYVPTPPTAARTE